MTLKTVSDISSGMARKQNETEDAYDRRIREAKERLAESRSRNVSATPAPPEPIEIPVPKEPDEPMTTSAAPQKKSLAAWRLVLIVAALVVVAMALFPPWCRYSPCSAAGYAFILRPPAGARMDTARLTIQILAAVVVAALLSLAFRPTPNNS